MHINFYSMNKGANPIQYVGFEQVIEFIDIRTQGKVGVNGARGN